MALLQFDSSKIEIKNDFELLPSGDYIAIIADSEWKETKNKDGQFLSLKVEIIDGKYKGRFIFDNLNLDNKNEKAVQIAQQTLASICLATNKVNVNDSSELHDIPLIIKVGVQPAQGGYDESNRIKGYKANGGTVAQPSAQAPTASANTRPWAKK